MMMQTILGIDYGLKRVGVAVGNTLTHHAEPLNIIVNTSPIDVLAPIQKLVKEWQVSALVLGLPRHPDGAEHRMTQVCSAFGVQLEQATGLPVHLVDERYSSVALPQQTQKNQRGQIRNARQDDQAAALILQQYLDTQAQ